MPDKFKILVDRRVLRGFVRRAWKVFPKEYTELIWGTFSDHSVIINALREVEHKATPIETTIQYDVLAEQYKDARLIGMAVLGDIHTHTDNRDVSPSEADWKDGAANKMIVLGICCLWKTGTGRRMSRTKFYPVAEYTLEVTNKEPELEK